MERRESAGPSPDPDGAALARDLAREVRGEVRFDAGARALYATDASNYRQPPIGVVVPDSVEDALVAIAVCRRHGAPIVTRGAGTSLAGQACNRAVVLDFSRRVRRVLAIDPQRRLARVEPGAVLDDLRRDAARHGLTFGPDPATHAVCTVGGMIGNDSCGVHSVLARFEGEGGRTADNVAELEVATYGGARMRVGKTDDAELARILAAGGRKAEIFRALAALRDRYAAGIREKFPKIPRRVSGYNLPALLPENGFHVARALTGTEGTCVTILEATLHLLPLPPARVLLVAGFPDVFAAGDAVPRVLAHRPSGLEGLDDGLVRDMRDAGLHPDGIAALPPGGGWLFVELPGDTVADAEEKARRLAEDLARERPPPAVRIVIDPAEIRRLWHVRESGLPATAHPPGKPLTWEGWEDSAVPPERLGAYLRDQRRLWEKHGYRGDLYGHFGDGCVHTRLDFDLETPDGRARFRAFLDDAADLVLSYGGSLSGEHGDGQSRAELLPKMFGPEIVEAFREFKRIWDPDGRLNPGKVVDPLPILADLRLDGGRPRPDRPLAFRYPEDGGDFARAALRCVGVGKCVATNSNEVSGTMCPSYRATGEERHSTRGRARLLFEMLRGQVLPDRWHSEELKEALDLCLSCKACKSECPVSVDMATYKAEFLFHYYRGRRRPRTAHLFGQVHRWARLLAPAAGAANAIAATAPGRRLLAAAAGIDPRRRIPRLARRTFRSWFRHRSDLRSGKGPSVLLWPDTFTNFFEPNIARAAVETLEAAGFSVAIPERDLCCGRPLYDWGMLEEARHLLRGALAALRESVRRGLPILFLEPSCAAVFRDELPGLLPDEPDAAALAGSATLFSTFLAARELPARPARMPREAIVQLHCHEEALFGRTGAAALLDRLGVAGRFLPGCCGMAGAFGFEKGDRYRVSIACAERALVPELARAPADALVSADGFSCREQIRQLTGREPRHSAELAREAIGPR